MVGLVLFCASFALYAVTADPAIGWLDSPEFAAAAHDLGISHAPGHPLFAILAKGFLLVPVGELAFRANLFSAACAAAAVAATYLLVREVVREGDAPPSNAARTIAAVVAAAVAVTPALWSEAARAEVYTLSLALTTGGLALAVRYLRTRRVGSLALAGLVFGLALANHHLLAITVLLPVALVVLAARPGVRAAGITAAAGALGLATYLYLPVRAMTLPRVSFGYPATLENFWWTLSGAAFHKQAGAEHTSSIGVDLIEIIAAWMQSPVLVVLAVVGAYAGLSRTGRRPIAAALCAVVVVSMAARALLGFDPETPDHNAYLLPSVAALAALAGIGLCAGYEALRRSVGESGGGRKAALVAAAIAACAVVGPPFAFAVHSDDRGRVAYNADEFARFELDGLPARSVLLTAYFQTRFRSWALRSLEGARPDVDIIDRSFLTYPGAVLVAKARNPELADLMVAAGDPIPRRAIDRVAAERPVWFQLHPNLDRSLFPRLSSIGAHARYEINEVGERDRNTHERIDAAAREAIYERLGGDGMSLSSQLAMLWHDAMRIDFFCTMGRRAAAQHALSRALHMFEGDRELLSMAQACGLEAR